MFPLPMTFSASC